MNSFLFLFSLLGLISTADANPSPKKVLSAEESDPGKLGWMIGSPPPKSKIITQPESIFFGFPMLRWSVCNLRQLLPTKVIQRDSKRFSSLDAIPSKEQIKLEGQIDSITFQPMNSSQTMTWKESLDANYTDGIIIFHRNKLIYQKSLGCLGEDSKHAAMSMTKSVTGILTEILIYEKKIDEKALVKDIIPEIGSSAFASATVRQVLDMTTGVRFSEDYSDPNADIWQYSKAASPLPKSPDYKGPDGYWEYLQQVKHQGKHGQLFGYKTINSDMLGWLIARVTGKPLTEVIEEKLWKPMGAEYDAYMTVDGHGVAFAGGGLTAHISDMGRLGLLMLNRGKIHGKQVIPSAVVESIAGGGDRTKFGKNFPSLGNASYRSQWWVFHNKNNAFAARGVHGQTIYVDPVAEMVIVRFASHPQAKNGKIDPTSLPAFQAVADFLVKKRKN